MSIGREYFEICMHLQVFLSGSSQRQGKAFTSGLEGEGGVFLDCGFLFVWIGAICIGKQFSLFFYSFFFSPRENICNMLFMFSQLLCVVFKL